MLAKLVLALEMQQPLVLRNDDQQLSTPNVGYNVPHLRRDDAPYHHQHMQHASMPQLFQ